MNKIIHASALLGRYFLLKIVAICIFGIIPFVAFAELFDNTYNEFESNPIRMESTFESIDDVDAMNQQPLPIVRTEQNGPYDSFEPALEEQAIETIDDINAINELPLAIIKTEQYNADNIFESALERHATESIANIEYLEAKENKQLREQAFNTQVQWQTDAAYHYLKTSNNDTNFNKYSKSAVLETKIGLEKVLWDKSLELEIEGLTQNIHTAKLNVFNDEVEFTETVLLAYLEFIIANELTVLSKKRITLLADLLQKIRHKKQLGYAANINVVEAQNQLDVAKTEALVEITKVETAKYNFEALSGKNVEAGDLFNHPFNLSNKPLSLQKVSIQLTSKILENVLSNNPKLKVMNSDLQTKQYNIRAVRAKVSSKVKLTSKLSQLWSRDDTDIDKTNFALGVTLTKPLYTGGRISTEIERAKLKLKSTERARLALSRQLSGKVHVAVAEHQGTLSSYNSLLRLKEQQGIRIDLIKKGIPHGVRREIDLYNALDSKFNIERNLIRQYFNLLKIKIKIMRLQGDLPMSMQL